MVTSPSLLTNEELVIQIIASVLFLEGEIKQSGNNIRYTVSRNLKLWKLKQLEFREYFFIGTLLI